MSLEQQILPDVSNRFPPDVISLFSNQQEINAAVKDTSEKPVEKKENKEKDLEKISLEETNKVKNPENEIENLREQYGLMEEQNLVGVDYDSLFSYLEHQVNPEEVYGKQEESEDNKRFWVMSDDEAEETVQKIQVSYMLGSKDSVSYEKKEMFSNWQEFNKSLLMLYHSLSPIKSDNVDYSKMN